MDYRIDVMRGEHLVQRPAVTHIAFVEQNGLARELLHALQALQVGIA